MGISILILILTAMIFPFLWKIPFLVRVALKKESFEARTFFFGALLNGGFALLFNFLIFLFMLLFNSPLWYRALFLYGTLSGLLTFLRIGERIFTWIKNKKMEWKETIKVFYVLALTIGSLMFDAFMFNQTSLRSNKEEYSVLPASSQVSEISGFSLNEQGLTSNSDTSSFVVSDLPDNLTTLTFEFEGSNSQFDVEVAVYQNKRWKRIGAFPMNANYGEYCQIKLPESANKYKFTFKLETTRTYNVKEYTLKSMNFDRTIPYSFSLTRGLAYILIFALLYKVPSLAKKKPDTPLNTGKIKLALAGGFLISFIALLIVALASPRGPSSLLVEYPLDESNYKGYDIFIKLFDAFRKGQLNLDYPVDEKLLALGEGVYVPSIRTGAHADYLFDHAFYNGQYFCYFGPVPVIFISFPVYLLTGMNLVPTGLFLLFVAFFAAIFCVAYLAVLLTEIFQFRPNPIAYISAIICLLFVGMFFNLVVFRQTDFMYRIPFTFGIANVLLFLCFTLEAYRGFHRRTFLALAGLAYVFIMGSRPDFGLWLIFISPLFLSMLIRKEKPLKERVFDFLPMAGVLVVGAGILVAYNVLRYGNPLEFGQTYQLTVNDMRTISLGFDDFPAAFYHYFLQPWKEKDTFGYITTAYTKLEYDTHPYKNWTIGLLTTPLPVFWLLLIPCFIKEKKIEWRFFYCLAPLTTIIIAWSIYGLGGTCFRYMLGIYPLSAIISLIAIARFISLDIGPKKKMAVYFGLAIVLVWSLYFGINLVPANFDGMRGEDLGGVFYYALRDLIGGYNTI